MSYYRTHRAYLEASRNEWLRELERSDEHMTGEDRKTADAQCRRRLSNVLYELEFGDVEIGAQTVLQDVGQ